jgi:hypothetical protein
VEFSDAFVITSMILKSSTSKSSTVSSVIHTRQHHHHHHHRSSYTSWFHPHSVTLLSKNDNGDSDARNERLFEEIDISEEFDEKFLEELERDKPSDWMVMKEVRRK